MGIQEDLIQRIQIFVFGSNLAGRHGKGSALEALRSWQATYGQAEGLQGRAYAIPTKDHQLRPLSLEEIKAGVNRFIAYARSTPHLCFLVTKIGCGLAGYREDQIRCMFQTAPDNCKLPDGWR